MSDHRAREHHCEFPEVEVMPGDFDADDLLQPGMKVLVPCLTCGETPLDHMGMLDGYLEEATETIKGIDPRRMLYHWAPASRRKQILRYGLRPSMRATTHSEWRAPFICFADSPSWAWALSGGMKWTPSGEWDLWETAMDLLTEPVILPGEDRSSGIYEVRTLHRVYKRNLWYIATRVK